MTAKAKNDTAKNNGASIARNKKAGHDYTVLQTLEAGVALVGTEVKSCRAHSVTLTEAFARVEKGELFVYGMNISLYGFGNRFNHEPARPRKLLMHKSEILKLSQQVKEKGVSLIPLALYFKNGRVKMEIGVCKGKTFGDKRETLRRRQDDLDARRAMMH